MHIVQSCLLYLLIDSKYSTQDLFELLIPPFNLRNVFNISAPSGDNSYLG